ncbi:MAG: N-formylglutamate amidohydrolase [Planctomycetota bacterium]
MPHQRLRPQFKVAIHCARWMTGLAVFSGILVAGAAEPHPLVTVEKGELPVILSAPHGGGLDIPGVMPREGKGLERRPGGFVIGRDTGTEELAAATTQAIQKRLGKRPYLVAARSHRKFLDPNREAAAAYESEPAQRVYEAYHGALSDACQQVRKTFQRGLLLDLHGQASSAETVFRGTQNGATVSLLKQRFGEASHTGDQSFFGQLRARGFKVHPDPLSGREQSGFTGGYTVRHYGGDGGFGIDAIQLEFGKDYRAKERRDKTAAVLAEAVEAFAIRYLDWKRPVDAQPSR